MSIDRSIAAINSPGERRPKRPVPAERVAQYSVLVVEDQAAAREHMCRSIGKHPELRLAAEAATFADGLAALRKNAPDVLLTDLGLPDGNGVDLIKATAELDWRCEAIVITVFGDERHVVEALQAGAGGYLLKDDSSTQIGGAILQMLAGGAPISPAIAKHLLKQFRAPAAQDPSAKEPEREVLTRKEQDVLQLVSKGFTAAEIGEMQSISYHTVTTHVKRIYRKLAINSRAEAVYEAMRLGLIDRGAKR